MNITIDIDQNEARRELTLRERVAIHLLLVAFRWIVPAKYDHQVNRALAPIVELLAFKKD
jgi:hypothetical protein